MVKVAVIYYSMYGHIKKMAESIKEGLSAVDGVEVTVLRVPETLPDEVLAKMHAPPKADDPVVTTAQLLEFDAFVFGVPTRFGTAAAQMKAFIDTTGGHWQSGGLLGKPYGVFTSTATQSGGQETTIISMITNLTAHGMIFVPSGYICPGTQFDLSEAHGGSPWGPGTLAGGDGSRQPSAKELDHAKTYGTHFGKIAKKF